MSVNVSAPKAANSFGFSDDPAIAPEAAESLGFCGDPAKADLAPAESPRTGNDAAVLQTARADHAIRTKGTIVKALAGYYYVKTAQDIFQCRARGIFRKEGLTPYVGDEVMIEIQDEDEGVVSEILPRRNSFIRPPVANVDLLVAVVAVTQPEPNPEILDRFLVMAEAAGVEVAICVNKIDLCTKVDEITAIYGKIYPMAAVSAVNGTGADTLKKLLAGRRAAFAGPSGVGKSSLINLLLGDGALETGVLSDKTSRGKHTTRHVEIYETAFGEILDTPGYTSFDGACVEEDTLDSCFPEFVPYLSACRFDDCRHLHEPDCAVQGALAAGKIAASRYASYLRMLGETQEQAKRY